jgi:hypothetical protein
MKRSGQVVGKGGLTKRGGNIGVPGVFEAVAKWILFAASGALFTVGTLEVHLAGAAQGGVIYGAAILSLLFAFLSRFKRFKGFGIEGEMWDQAQERAGQLSEMLQTRLDAIDRVLVSMATVAFSALSSSGRMGPLPRRRIAEHVDQLDRDLREAGLPAERIEEAKTEYYRHVAFDLARPIYSAILEELVAVSRSVSEAMAQFRQPIDAKDPQHQALVAQHRAIGEAQHQLRSILENFRDYETLLARLEQFLETTAVIDSTKKVSLRSTIKDHVADLKHFVETKRLLRPETYFAEPE